MYISITTTTYQKKIAKAIAHELIRKKLAACVQIDSIQSIYMREEKMCDTKEYRLTIKTKKNLYSDVVNTIIRMHNYKTPQITANTITYISQQYAHRIDMNTKK